MVLDASKKNEQHDEFGGCHLGYIKGVWRSPDATLHDFKFTSARQHGGVDALSIVDQTANEARAIGYEEGYAKGLADGGGYTEEDLKKARAEGINEGKKIQVDYEKNKIVLAP
jgi:hypothetical protein